MLKLHCHSVEYRNEMAKSTPRGFYFTELNSEHARYTWQVKCTGARNTKHSSCERQKNLVWAINASGRPLKAVSAPLVSGCCCPEEWKVRTKKKVNAVIELIQTDGYWTLRPPYNSHLKLWHWVRFSLQCRTSCFLHQSQEKPLKHLPVGQNEVVWEEKDSFKASSTAPNIQRRVAVVKSSYWQLQENFQLKNVCFPSVPCCEYWECQLHHNIEYTCELTTSRWYSDTHTATFGRKHSRFKLPVTTYHGGTASPYRIHIHIHFFFSDSWQIAIRW